MPQSGAKVRRITIARYSITYNDDNEPVEVWTPDAAPLGASWRRASARETLAGAEINATATDVFEVDYWAGTSSINPKDRLLYQGSTYDIASCEEIGRREGLRIGASRRADT